MLRTFSLLPSRKMLQSISRFFHLFTGKIGQDFCFLADILCFGISIIFHLKVTSCLLKQTCVAAEQEWRPDNVKKSSKFCTVAPPLPAVKFPPGVQPTKRQVLERYLHFRKFRTAEAANDVANEIYDRWLWCNVYSLHRFTISKKCSHW